MFEVLGVYEHVQVRYIVQVVVEHVQVQRVYLVQIGLSLVWEVLSGHVLRQGKGEFLGWVDDGVN